MFYYKNKVKPIVILCLVILALTVSFTVCLWDDTSLKSLTANAGTADFTGKLPNPLAVLEEGGRLSIDGINYTVGYKGTEYMTVYSDNMSSKIGGRTKYNDVQNHNNYTGSDIHIAVTGYYTTLKEQPIKVGDKTYGKVSDYAIVHKDYGWYLWLPSVREVGLSDNRAQLQGSVQEPMRWYNSDTRRKQYVSTSYWLRSPLSDNANYAFNVSDDGSLYTNYVNNSVGATRVALNLKI